MHCFILLFASRFLFYPDPIRTLSKKHFSTQDALSQTEWDRYVLFWYELYL